jgi:hypothetical protein
MLLLFVAPQPAIPAAGYINTALVVSDLWAPLNARSAADAIFWNEAQMYAWIDEAKTRLARKHDLFVDYDQSVTTASGVGDYALPAAHLKTIQADLNGKVLRARNVQEMEALDSRWNTATPDEPKAFLEDTQGLVQLTLTPAPSVSFESLPVGLAMSKLPPTIAASSGILAAPPVIQEYFTYSALAEARSIETNASMDEIADWLRGIVGLIDQVAEGLWN